MKGMEDFKRGVIKPVEVGMDENGNPIYDTTKEEIKERASKAAQESLVAALEKTESKKKTWAELQKEAQEKGGM